VEKKIVLCARGGTGKTWGGPTKSNRSRRTGVHITYHNSPEIFSRLTQAKELYRPGSNLDFETFSHSSLYNVLTIIIYVQMSRYRFLPYKFSAEKVLSHVKSSFLI
jgi:hypothetical protein